MKWAMMVHGCMLAIHASWHRCRGSTMPGTLRQMPAVKEGWNLMLWCLQATHLRFWGLSSGMALMAASATDARNASPGSNPNVAMPHTCMQRRCVTTSHA